MSSADPTDHFARRVLAWFEHHGRRHLPWQQQQTPYRVWVSEIMLQQTQVATVVPYFQRFARRFPDVAALAAAPVDDVLHHWSGLGYYARGRNLHRAAQVVVEQHGGELPSDLDALAALPGIGRSTAGAILALGHGRRAAILDGNVKRVLARFHEVDGWPGQAAVARELWRLAERHTPSDRIAEYTQAMMDLGATVCLRTRPLCAACPVADDCRARAAGRVAELPARKPTRERPRREVVFLLLRDGHGRLLLERRPPSGIWGGLWGFPECAVDADAGAECRRRFGLAARPEPRQLDVLHHGFTHFELDIYPRLLHVSAAAGRVMEGARTLWYNPADPAPLGLPAPVARLIEAIADQSGGNPMGTVKCVKLGEEAEALAAPPYPGELGQRIFENVSKPAWQQWLAHQTMLINEHRLSPRKPEDRKFLETEMEKFLFGGGSEKPAGYVPPGDGDGG